MPTELIVADFFVYASVPFAGHCLKDTVAHTKGKKKMPSPGHRRGQKCYITPAFSGVPKQRGAKSEMATSTLFSQRPKGGWKC